MRMLLVAVLLFGVASAARAAPLGGYTVTFQTVECNGDTGVGTAPVDRIFKIQALECDSPSGRKLKQVLVRGPRSGAYEVFDVTEAEAARIQKEIERHMRARQKALEGGRTVIIEH